MNQFKNTDIIIADNQFLIIEALKILLSDRFTIKSIVNCKVELQEAFHNGVPELLIADHSFFDFDGVEDLKEIKRQHPDLKIVILTNSITTNELTELNSIGIKNILHKNCDSDEFFSCLDAVLKGKKYYSGIILDMILDINEKKKIPDEMGHLTGSEIEIVRLIAQGLTTKEIARKKFLSSHTVMTHRKNILRKLGVSNASELIMVAVRRGIIDTIEYHI